MRYGRISDLIRRSAGALLLLGSLGVSSDRLFAEDANCATPAPACTPQCSDDVYKRAGERLAQQLQQMGGQPCGQAQCASGCDTVAPGCMSDGCTKGSCLFGGLFSHGDGCAEEKKDPWTLMSVFDDECGNNWLKDNGLTIGGWLALGYSTDPDGAFTGNGAALNQREHNNLNINQLYMYVAKVADGSKGFDWGFRADLIYGVDGNDTQSFGNRAGKFDFLNGWGGPGDPNTHGPYEWAMPQLYAEVAMGDLSVKAGHFYTPIGYEVVTTPDNFFFSKQLTFYNSEPFTHTGALATYKVNDKLTLIGGWTLGWDTGFDQNMKGSNAIFGATYAASDTTTLVYSAAVGEFGSRGNGAINSFILSQKWGEKLMTVHQFDVLNTNNPVDFTAGGVAGESTGFINYVFYQLTDKAKAGARYEWYKADGTSHNTFTYGVNYQLTPNVVVRPEVRHNWAPGNDVSPFNEDIFGIDAVLKF